MSKSHATYESDDILVKFSGRIVDDETGSFVEDVEIEEVHICGVEMTPDDVPEKLQAALYALHENLDFEEDDYDGDY